MATHVSHSAGEGATPIAVRAPLDWLAPVGRTLFGLIFVLQGVGHFSAQSTAYAASVGVPLASLAVPLSGALALAGGLSVALGYRARIGALLLVAFLVPVTLVMHAFWAIPDPMTHALQKVMFLKNVSMLGAALLVLRLGPGPFSFDARTKRESPR